MSDLHDIIRNYTIKYDRKIKTICEPLKLHLNIPVFSYYYIDKDGQLITLSNYPEQMDFYYAKQLYLDNPYLSHPHLLRSGCVLLETTPDKKFLEEFTYSKNDYNMYNTFLIIERQENTVEGYFFADHQPNNLNVNYINQLELLKKFSRYFKREAAPYLKKIKADQYNIKEVKGDSFLQRDPSLPLSFHDVKAQNFLKSISPLSHREQQCLELFQKGHSAQATAALLGLSRRTVEHYFDTIKNKLDCNSKWDLLNQ